MKAKSFLYYWLPVVLYAGAIFYFSSLKQPFPAGGIEFEGKDLVLHATEYFVLAALLLRALMHSAVRKPYVASIAVSALYGITDEIHQLFVAGRVFSAYDMMADAFGACVILAFYVLEKKVNKKDKIVILLS